MHKMLSIFYNTLLLLLFLQKGKRVTKIEYNKAIIFFIQSLKKEMKIEYSIEESPKKVREKICG